MDYLIKITNTTTLKSVKVVVKSEKELKKEELSKLSPTLFKTLQNQPLSTVKFEDIKISPHTEETNLVTSVRKIEQVNPIKVQKKTRKQIYRNLVKNQPHSPLKFLWTLFVAPFSACRQFKNQEGVISGQMHEIFGTGIESQHHFNNKIQRTYAEWNRGLVDSDEQVHSIFENGIKSGNLIEKFSKTSASQISSLITANLGPKDSLKFLGFIPITLKIEGTPTPLLLMFRQEGDWLYLEVQGLPEGAKTPLASEYALPLSDAEKTIPAMIQSFLSAYASSFVEEKSVHLSSREKIQLQNVEHFGKSAFPEAPSDPLKKESQEWLHEMLCNYANPTKTSRESSKDPMLVVFDQISRVFPESSSMDKLEWLLSSFEQEYSAFLSGSKYLNSEDRIFFFERLIDHAKILQNKLKPLNLAEAPEVFQNFYRHVAEIKKQTEFHEELFFSQGEKLQTKIKTRGKGTLQIPIPEKIFSLQTKKTTTDGVNKELLAPEQLLLVQNLKQAIEKADPIAISAGLQAIHQAADLLIEKKQYLAAQKLALLGLDALPIPEYTGGVVQALYLNKQSVQFSEGLAGLVKDVWESSLRLNAPYCPPDQILCLMKAQVIHRALGCPFGPDPTEFKSILQVHPHLRFGWTSAHFADAKKILNCLEHQSNPPNTRYDEKNGLVDINRSDQKYVARMQMMMTSLMKPDYCLTPFFGTGAAKEAKGLAWLDNLEARAVANGAKTRDEVKKTVQEIRLKETVKCLKEMKRLDLHIDTFVTDVACITLVDPSAPRKSVIAYLPNGYGLPREFEEKYGVAQSQSNTSSLVGGKARGEERFIGEFDGNRIVTSGLSPQVVFTEPTLYQQNLQKPPRGQVSQTENYLIDASQVGKAHQIALNAGSIVEGLNLLFNERNLADLEVQRSILLLLTRTGLLEENLKENPKEILAIAAQLKKLVEKKGKDPLVLPFLLQIGEIIYQEAKTQNLAEITSEIPSFKNGQKWLEAILADPNADRTGASIAYLFALTQRPKELITDDMIPSILYAAMLFPKISDVYGLPVLNLKVQDYITKELLPHILSRMQDKKFMLTETMNQWADQALPASKQQTSAWVIESTSPFIVGNQDFKVDLSTLQTVSKKTGERMSTVAIKIPPYIQRSDKFLKLFGSSAISAEIFRGNDPFETIYSFSYGPLQAKYRAIHNQLDGSLEIQSQLPSEDTWYTYVAEFPESKEKLAPENFISQNGLWLNSKNPRQGYFASSPLTSAKKKDLYRVILDKKGMIDNVATYKENSPIALMSTAEVKKIAPFANAASTLIVLSPKGKIQQIRSIDQKGVFTHSPEGKWIYTSPTLGDAAEWVTDLNVFEKGLSEDTQERRFLASFGKDQQQFLLPVMQGEDVHFLIFPYKIHSCHNARVDFDASELALSKGQSPLSLSFDKEGNLKGSPSSLLYLSYYFGMKKDYERALYYLKKANEMPAVSEKEKESFEKIAALFMKFPHGSSESLSFQLKAHLAIRDILRTQFSTPHYRRESENEFFAHITHIAKLYKQYSKKEPSLHENTSWRLKEEDKFKLDRIVWTSFDHWIEKQREKDALKISKDPSLQTPPKFLETKITKGRLDELQSTLLACFVLEDFSSKKSLDSLLKEGRLKTESTLRNFFHFYTAIQNGSPADISRILNVLLAEPSWQIDPPKNKQEQRFAKLADNLRLMLTLTCLIKEKGGELTQLSLASLDKRKTDLPYVERETSIKPLRFLMNMYDLSPMGGTVVKVETLDRNSMLLINSLIDQAAPFVDRTIGELLGHHPKRPDETAAKEQKGGASLKTIEEALKNLPKDHAYLPLELTELPRLIEDEDADLEKARDIMTLIRESETRGTPILAIRAMSELMREIQKKEQALTKKTPPIQEARDFDHTPTLALQNQCLEEMKPFATFSEKDKAIQAKALANLDEKYKTALAHFADSKAKTPFIKEEYKQLRLGFEIANKGLTEELSQKQNFTQEEKNAFGDFLKKHLEAKESGAIKTHYLEKRKLVLKKLKQIPQEKLPSALKKKINHPDIYTDAELISTLQKLYKNPIQSKWLKESGLEQDATELLLYTTAHEQLLFAQKEFSKGNVGKALGIAHAGLQLDRYKDTDPLIAQKCLVAEARAGIVYRPGQRDLIDKIAKNPQSWASLRMGLGKTSYAIPTIAEILAEQGRSVVLTVPEKLLKSNRKDFDKATRLMFDRAGMEFSLPLTKEVPINFLAEKALQIETIFEANGYIVTTAEELATLHDTCIMLEDEKLELFKKANLEKGDEKKLLMIELRLHYYKKMDRLLTGEATELNIPHALFGDETDDTHNITHEVSIAIGDKVDPSKEVREVSRTLLEIVMESSKSSPLHSLKTALMENTFSVLDPKKEIPTLMQELAKTLLTDKKFLNLLGDKKDLLKNIDPEEWASYLVGTTNTLPKNLPAWNAADENLLHAQKMIGAVKQLLTTTFPSFLTEKSGNNFGLSDFEGFIVVPKETKNESLGMRYADEFQMIFAQYLGHFEFTPCESLTDKSEVFLQEALKTFKEKSPQSYGKFLQDYKKHCESLKDGKAAPELIDYLKTPAAYVHRWNILDDVILDGGFIKRFQEQVHTNVQEIFHKRQCGGVTGTLDPYVLPFISEDITLNKKAEAHSSTREVEAETFLRMSLNVEKGLDQPVLSYSDQNPFAAVDSILANPQATGFINSIGDTSEGMDTLEWITLLKKRPSGKNRSFLFMHPKERIPYLWSEEGKKAVPYKAGQKLPPRLLCIYAPSDVRGVDLPIQPGEVHMLVSPTASIQEYVQSLYRARQIGGDHQIQLHLPNSLKEKIATGQATYGDTINYLILRSSKTKLDLNLNAILSRIQFDLKTSISRFLKEINPQMNEHEFFSEKVMEKILLSAKAHSLVFEKVRPLYIQSKKIEFEGCYSPRQTVTGIKKVLNEYVLLEKTIDELLPEIKKASIQSMLIIHSQDALTTNLNQFIETLNKHPELKTEVKSFQTKLMTAYQKQDTSAVFDILSDFQLEIEKKGNLPKDILLFIPETIYGKGRSHLYNTIRDIKGEISTQVKSFNSNIEEHKKYLPELTTSNSIGNAGTNEQVKELQEQKVQEQEKQEEPSDAEWQKTAKPKVFRAYQHLSSEQLIDKTLPLLSPNPPFNKCSISPEAADFIQVVPMMTADPLFYFAVNMKDHKLTVITKQDYQKIRLSIPKDIAIFSPIAEGVRFVNGAGNPKDPLPKALQLQFLTMKAYLGYKEEFAKNEQLVKDWVSSLSAEDKKGILDHVSKKGTPSQRKVLENLL